MNVHLKGGIFDYYHKDTPYYWEAGSKLKDKKVAGVYFIYCKQSDSIKIGMSRNIYSRYETIDGYHPVKLDLVAYMNCFEEGYASKVERALHANFASYYLRHEWFLMSDEIKLYIGAHWESFEHRGALATKELKFDLALDLPKSKRYD